MSKISTALRAAALGPTPKDMRAYSSSWVPQDCIEIVAKYSDGNALSGWLHGLTDCQRRIYLLLVAEAEE